MSDWLVFVSGVVVGILLLGAVLGFLVGGDDWL